jgi:hypothetical protein
MKKELDFSELDYKPNVPTPPPVKNAGLYTGDVLFDKKPWGNNYKQPRVPPDAVAYASQFYASHHIPSHNRPGNNHLDSKHYTEYKTLDPNAQYNFYCYT